MAGKYARVLKIDYGQEEYIEMFGHDQEDT